MIGEVTVSGPRIDLYHHVVTSPDPRIDQILALLQLIASKEDLTMATLADITAAVQAEKTVEDGVVTLLQKIEGDLATAIASNDPAAMQAVVDMIHTNMDALSAAVVANVPAPAPAPPAP